MDDVYVVEVAVTGPKGAPKDRVAEVAVCRVLSKECTSYNVGNVFGKHLSFEPWDATRNLTLLPSLSVRLPGDLRGPPEQEHILIRRAYGSICPGDPAGVGERNHAIDLAQMAASVAAAMRREGIFRRCRYTRFSVVCLYKYRVFQFQPFKYLSIQKYIVWIFQRPAWRTM